MYVDQPTLRRALSQLYGTAGHLLKIWFVLKHMGLRTGGTEVFVDTANSTDSLKVLFDCGAPDNRFYVPFAHTSRYLTMKHDASRSIIQTNVQRWASSGSVVTCDPTGFLDTRNDHASGLTVRPTRAYPLGLGIDESGFALEDGQRVSLPLVAFSVWFGRWTKIPEDTDPVSFLIQHMLNSLGITDAEKSLLFVDARMSVSTHIDQLTRDEVFEVCSEFLSGKREPEIETRTETFDDYARKVKGMVSDLSKPVWLRISPEEALSECIDSGARAVVLYGPPRTGKTRAIDQIVARNSDERETIQIHDGWGYDNLVQGFRPDSSGNWDWHDGPLKTAIEAGKRFIVLEEINRTNFSQSLGEIFSLLEDAYRGEQASIRLRDGNDFFIPEDTVFLMTMNTVDKSTEEVDDALFGRMAAIEFPARAEDLNSMLASKGIPSETISKLAELFSAIQEVYPMGHGYFSGINSKANASSILSYYRSRIRPVLFNFLGELKEQELNKIDNTVDSLFGES